MPRPRGTWRPSIAMPWTSASASASTEKMPVARSATGLASPLSRSHSRISAKRRWGWCTPGSPDPACPLPPAPAWGMPAEVAPGFRPGFVRVAAPGIALAAPLEPGSTPPAWWARPAPRSDPPPDAGAVWKRRPRRMPSVNGSDRTRTISCRRHSASPAASASARSEKASRSAAGEHVAGYPADGIQMDVHPRILPRFPRRTGRPASHCQEAGRSPVRRRRRIVPGSPPLPVPLPLGSHLRLARHRSSELSTTFRSIIRRPRRPRHHREPAPEERNMGRTRRTARRPSPRFSPRFSP